MYLPYRAGKYLLSEEGKAGDAHSQTGHHTAQEGRGPWATGSAQRSLTRTHGHPQLRETQRRRRHASPLNVHSLLQRLDRVTRTD